MTEQDPTASRPSAAPRQQAGGRVTPSAGRERWEKARRRALARTGDPQHTGGRPARDWSRACACGHSGRWHNIEHVKAECSVATAAGPCGCRAYSPPEEARGA